MKQDVSSRSPRQSSPTLSLIAYATLVLLLTAPFWVVGMVFDVSILPGLPIAALAVVVPTLAATIVSSRIGGRAALGALFAPVMTMLALPLRGGLAAIGVPVAFTAAAWTWRVLTGHTADFALPFVAAIPLLALLLGAALLEEFGWTAFATDRLRACFGVLGGALVLGLGWALWHYPALIEANRSLDWMAWWTIWTVGQRVAMVALYYRFDRNFGVPVLFHATSNFAWQMAPDAFEPVIEALAIGLIAVVLSLGPARERNRPSP